MRGLYTVKLKSLPLWVVFGIAFLERIRLTLPYGLSSILLIAVRRSVIQCTGTERRCLPVTVIYVSSSDRHRPSLPVLSPGLLSAGPGVAARC
jgi:hypothetical protein